MRVPMTEYLMIDLESERWICRMCGHDFGDARDTYKKGTLIYDRNPEEIHQAIIDPKRYKYTFAPDPKFCRIYEYYCPTCGTQIETDYVPPHYPPIIDMLWDIDDLKRRWKEIGKNPEEVINYGPRENAVADLRAKFDKNKK
ncbi:acetone carboxylase subunit gamma [Helicobacter mustelae]|nr:acetone carboxylase subunit gamma [Helicobacter mustelae]SQH71272.1 Acetophenone carboxylase subunit Apc2 [Helicobacter mustelae]STP12397.1 Acetophenone carboxylase subunit Apc2 [Helicobacter mustelae]